VKLTAHNGRVDSAGLHNDRNYDVNQSPHINQEKMRENRYFTYNGNYSKTLNEIEMDYYKEHFEEQIKKQNRKNIEGGHRERNKTVTQYYKGQHTRPEDKILQIGNKDSHVDPDVLWECALEFQKRFDQIYGQNCKILNMALHVDEETPHVHIRRVWTYKDENGVEKVGQTKALQELGITAYDQSKEEGRYNNAKISFTSQERELFREICREKGVELEPDTPANRKHLSVPEFKEMSDELERMKVQKIQTEKELELSRNELEQMEETCKAIEEFLTRPMFYNIHDQEVAEAKKKNMARRIAELAEIMKEEAGKITAEAGSFRAAMEEARQLSHETQTQKEARQLNHKVEILSQFIVDKGLAEEFSKYAKTPKPRQSQSPHKKLI